MAPEGQAFGNFVETSILVINKVFAHVLTFAENKNIHGCNSKMANITLNYARSRVTIPPETVNIKSANRSVSSL